MNKKEYIKPEVTIIKVELESLILGNSVDGGDSGEGSYRPSDQYEGDAGAKDDGGSSDIWGDEW